MEDAAGTGDGAAQVTASNDRGRGIRGWTRIFKWLGGLFLALLLVIVALAVWPADLDGLDSSDGAPASSYDEAMQKFNDWAADEEDLNVLELCRSAVYGPGTATEVSVVLLHGLTNCPEQYLELAQEIADQGVNVVVLRAPLHGIADESGTAIGDVSEAADLDADDLTRWADASVDIAEGLGDEVRVLGLSMGGATAAWIAQNREVERVVAVAPALTLHGMPSVVDTAVLNLAPRLPHLTVPGPATLDHAYAGETIHGAAEMYRLAAAVRRDASVEPPQTRDITVIVNPADDQVDNEDIDNLAESWRTQGAKVERVTLDFGVDLPHDVVDPGQPTGRTDLTWPVFLQSLE